MKKCAKCKKPRSKCECRREKNRSLSGPPVDRMMNSSRKDAYTKW